MPQQFKNLANPEVHRADDSGGDLAGYGGCGRHSRAAVWATAGTITGVGEAIKVRKPDVSIVAVEPAASPVLSGGAKGPHPIQGIGAGFVPDILDTEIYDEIIQVDNEDALATARRAATEEGLLVGIPPGRPCGPRRRWPPARRTRGSSSSS